MPNIVKGYGVKLSDDVVRIGDAAPAGTVMLETPSGVVDASVMTQLDNLRDYFMRQDQQQTQQ